MTDSNSTPQPDIWLNEYEARLVAAIHARSTEQEAAIAGLVNEATDLCRALESGPESWKAARTRVALAAARASGLVKDVTP